MEAEEEEEEEGGDEKIVVRKLNLELDEVSIR